MIKNKVLRLSSCLGIASLSLGGLLVSPTAVAALATFPFEVTGVLTSVSTVPIPANAAAVPPVPAALGTITVNGLVIPVAANDDNAANGVESISSPTAELTIAQLSAAPVLLGRTQNGFLGGTVTVSGKVIIETIGADGGKVKAIIAKAVDVDPGSEFAVLATVSEANCTNVSCTAAGNFIKNGY